MEALLNTIFTDMVGMRAPAFLLMVLGTVAAFMPFVWGYIHLLQYTENKLTKLYKRSNLYAKRRQTARRNR